VEAAVLRYRVMAYVTGVVLVVLCFVAPAAGGGATRRWPTTSRGARILPSRLALRTARSARSAEAAVTRRRDHARRRDQSDHDGHRRSRWITRRFISRRLPARQARPWR